MRMNRHVNRQRIVLAMFLSISGMPSIAAAPNPQAEKQLVAKVFTDGTLFGFAKACKVSEPELKVFYDKTFASSRRLGMSTVPHYSQQDFRRDFQNGISTADRFSASVAPTSKAYIKNCEEVRQKIKSVVGAK